MSLSSVKTPVRIAVASSLADANEAGAKADDIDYIELRLDQIPGDDLLKLQTLAKGGSIEDLHLPAPLILTFRDPSESINNTLYCPTPKDSVNIMINLFELADGFDIEVKNIASADGLLRKVRGRLGKFSIASAHYFESEPGVASVREHETRARNQNCDFLCVEMKPTNLTQWTDYLNETHSLENIALINVNETKNRSIGKSVLEYYYVSKATSPNQQSYTTI